MTYAARMRATARRITRHLGNDAVTITQRVAGTGSTAYTTRGKVLSDSDFFERTGTTQLGDLAVMVVRESGAWNPSVATPAENDAVAVDGRSGIVQAVHTKVPVWILDCKE